jgi:hypothetical protein
VIERDEFYIGYDAGVPPGMRPIVVRTVMAAIAIALGVAVVFVSQQRPLADSRFEFGTTRSFAGYLTLSPAPALIVVDRYGHHPHWLVARGKFGAAAALGDVAAGWVTLSGSLIEREGWRMIEVAAGSVRPHSSAGPPPVLDVTSSRRVTLTGEIVDGKCYLGVMNPGERTVHRDCAARCLAGGVPAMFAYRDASGAHLALLLGAGAARREADVGRSIILSGALSGPEDALVFAIADAD